MQLAASILSLGFETLDEIKAEANASGLDFYKLVIIRITGSKYEDVLPADRMIAKETLFGYMYGTRPAKIAAIIVNKEVPVPGNPDLEVLTRLFRNASPKQRFLILKKDGEVLRAFPFAGWEPNLDRLNHITEPMQVVVEEQTLSLQKPFEGEELLSSESKAIIQIVLFLKEPEPLH